MKRWTERWPEWFKVPLEACRTPTMRIFCPSMSAMIKKVMGTRETFSQEKMTYKTSRSKVTMMTTTTTMMTKERIFSAKVALRKMKSVRLRQVTMKALNCLKRNR